MAVGRITGPLLAKNLLRDGIDLSFETDLLYLDVNTGRIGVKTATPGYAFDVQGDANALALRVETVSTLANLVVYSTTATTYLDNKVGDIVIKAPVEKKIRLQNDTIVSGNLHASGNITADGSVQIGNITGSDTLSLYANIISNITPQTANQYNIGAPGKEWAKGYIDTLVASALTAPVGQDVNITPAPGFTANINGPIRVWGDNPLGTGVVTSNVLYVSTDGSDTNDGRAPDPSRACRTISGVIKSPYYKEGTSIKVAAGHYLENNPIELKPLTSVIGSDLRTTFVEPINKTQDLFHVRSGCYIAQMQMTNGQSGLLPGTGYTAGTNRGAYAVAFPPNYGGEKIDLYYSPYIQNCTNQSGPWLMDGTMFVPNQTVQIPSGVGFATWTANTTTMLVTMEEGTVRVGDTINVGPSKPGYVDARTLLLANKAFFQEQVVAYIDQKYEYYGYDEEKCIRDTGLIVDSLISDLVFAENGYTQSNFAGLQYWSQTTYTGQISSELTATTAAINYVNSLAQAIVQNISTGSYQSTLTQTSGVAATPVEAAIIDEEFNIIVNILSTGTNGITDIIEPNGFDVVSPNRQVAATLLLANKAYIQAEAIAFVNATFETLEYDRAKCWRDVGYMVDSVAFDLIYGGNRQAIQSGVYYYGFSDTASVIERERPQTSAAYFRIKEIVGDIITNKKIVKSPGNLSEQNTSLTPATISEAQPLEEMIDLILRIISGGPAASLEQTPIGLTRSASQNILRAANILQENRAFIISEVIAFVEYAYNNGYAYNQPKCYRDTGLIVDSVAMDLLYESDTQSTFAGLQYWNQDDYTGEIRAELSATVAAINYASSLAAQIVLNNTGTRYQSTITQTFGFVYDRNKCSRDVGLIIDAIALDLLFTTSSQSTFAGVQYWNHSGYVGDIAGELTTTTNAINYVKSLAQKIIVNDLSGTRYQSTVSQTTNYSAASVAEQTKITSEFDLITYLLTSTTALSTVTDIIVTNELTANTNTNIVNAYQSLQANKSYLQAEAVAFVESTKTIGFDYDQAKCWRDVGYMVDSVSFDLLYGGNLQAITSAVYYYGYNANSTALPDEQDQAVQTYNYLKTIIPNIIYGVSVGNTYQSAVSQTTSTTGGTLAESLNAQANLDIIKNIIINGPSSAGEPSPISLTRSTDQNVINAALNLRQNKEFIKAESIAYINRVIGVPATFVEATTVTNEFGIITNILTNGTLGVTDLIVPNGKPSTDTNKINAVRLLQENKQYIQAETVAFVNSKNQIFNQAKCARDTRLIVDAITQDLLFTTSSQSTFAGLQYWNQSSYTGLIGEELTTTTNAINYVNSLVQKIVVNDTTDIRYSTGTQITDLLNPGTAAEAEILKNNLDLIVQIINSGTTGVTDIIVPNGFSISPDINKQRAATLLQANKEYIKQEAIAFVEAVKSVGYSYDQALCARDTGYIVDAITIDLLYDGNRQSVQSGVYYYNFNGGASAITGEIENTISAYNKLKELIPYIVQGISYPTPSQLDIVQTISLNTGTQSESSFVQSKINLITDIILKGPSAVSAKTPLGVVESTSTTVKNAVSLLFANREFLVAEVLAYISNPTGFVYDEGKCSRDVGYMIDCVSFDILNGGNRQAVQAGVYYYDFNVNATAIPNEIPQTTAAYNHIRNIVSKILSNQAITPTTGNTATQVLLSSTATSAEILVAQEKIDLITNIINNGPNEAPTREPISLTITTSTSVQTAYDLLIANKAFIQSEVVAFVNQFDTGFVYNRAKCIRDIGIIVENIAYDIAFGGNAKSVESGLAYWNGVTSYIPNEITETTDAFDYLKTLAEDVVSNTTVTNLLNTYQANPQVFDQNLDGGAIAAPIIGKLIGIINNIIANGPEVAPVVQVGNGPDWGTVSAEVLLQTNRSFIQNEVLSWINYTYPDFSYREDKCYRDLGLIIDAITQDIVLNANAKTIEAAKTYWLGNKNVLENASFGNQDQVVETVAALERAKEVSLQVINNTTVTTTSFVFDPTRCSRDTGLIVDALAQDLLFQGDSQTTFAGIQYWNHGDYVGKIGSEISTTTAAINYVSQIAQSIVQNITTGTRYQSTVSQVTNLPSATLSEAGLVAEKFSTVTNILVNGVVGITDQIVPNNLTKSGNINVQNAFNLLQANKEYLKAEAIAFVEATKDFRYDEVKCSRDSGLIVDSIVMDLLYPTHNLSQSTFAGLSYWNQTSYTGQISGELTTTTNAINFVKDLAKKIIVGDDSGQRYSTGTQVLSSNIGSASEQAVLESEFNIITTILTTGTAGVTDLLEPNGINPITTTSTVNAYQLLIANKEYIKQEAVAYVEATKTPEFEYDLSLCARDVGYMVDSVAFDLLHGGNRQAIHSGVYYYTFDGSDTAIPNEIPQTSAAFEFIKALVSQLVLNVKITPMQTEFEQDTSLPAASADVIYNVNAPIEKVIKIIKNGPEVVVSKEPIALTKTLVDAEERAARIIDANREFIVAETIAYVNKYVTFQYDQEKCARDVGYIVDSVAFDVLYDGNRQSIQSGVYYWGYSQSSTSLPKERVASTLAYQFMKGLISNVVMAKTTSTYQNVITQTVNLPPATSVEVEEISANIDTIISIINDGPTAAKAGVPIGLIETNNQYTRNAVNLLAANREFIRAEVIAYVQETQVSNDQIFLPFYDLGANATLGIIRNYDLIINVIKNGPGVAPIKSQGNGIFVKTGLSPNDTKVAPFVTAVNTVSTGVYQIEIDQSTIGYGDNQCLYFGDTAVFPLLDNFVPERWEQRRLNPIGSMGGTLVDGGVISDRSPINSFVFDAFTQVNQGGQGIKVTNNGYAQLVSVFTIFCSNAVTVENGGICSITNSNSNFGDICLTAKGYGRREFSGYIKNPPILPYYPNGVYPQGGQVNVYIADPLLRPHIALVMEVEPPVGFINVQGLPGFLSGNVNIDVLTTGTIDIVGIDTTGFCIGQKFYVRDQYGRQVDENNQPYVKEGTIVADVNYQRITLNYPLNSGGGEVGNFNYFNLYSCGNAYYTVLSSTLAADPVEPGTLLLPNQQNIQEALSLDYINSLSQKIVNNEPVVPLQTTSTQVFDYTQSGGSGANSFISSRLDIIGNILENGTQATPEVEYNGTLPAGAGAAASLLNANKQFIQDEIIAYVDQNFFSFSYNQEKCARDTGLIVDAIAQDLLFETFSQTTFAGLQYWNQGTHTGNIPGELTTTTAAISYAKSLSQEIVQGIIGTRYSTGTQITNLTVATPAEAAKIAEEFDLILNIINSTTALSTVTDYIVPNSLTSSTNINIVRAYNLLQANKSYIQQEVIAYVNDTANAGFTYDQAKCTRDIGIIVDDLVQDLRFDGISQVTFAGVQYWNHGSYVGSIAGELTTTTNAINYVKDLAKKIIVNDTTGARYTTGTQITNLPPASNVEQEVLAADFEIIVDILNRGVEGVSDAIIPNGTSAVSSNAQLAYNLLKANREYLQAETVAYVEATKTVGFTYDQEKCSRDAGYMIDSVAHDLLYGGNRQAIQSGVYYYGYNGSSTALPGEQTQAVAAYTYLKSILPDIIQGNTIVSPYQSVVSQVTTGTYGNSTQAGYAQLKIDIINDIIINGPSVAGTPTSISSTLSSDPNALYAAEMIAINKNFLKAEVIAYINETYDVFAYDPTLCARDVGYMIDSVSIDLLYGGNRQAVQSGVYYYGFTTATVIENEIPQTIDAYNHIADLTKRLVLGQQIVPQQTAVSPVTNMSTGTTAETNSIETLIGNLTSLINVGPTAAIVNVPLPTTASSDADAINAAMMIKSNREFIASEVIAYVELNNSPAFTYDQEKCYRDTLLLVDAIAQDVMFESLSQSIFSGVQYWNHGEYVGSIASELTTTTNAINYVKSLAQKVIVNDTTGVRYQTVQTQNTSLPAGSAVEATILGNDFNVILNILENGVEGVTDIIVPNNIVASSTATVQNAFAALLANKEYLQAEAIAYVESTKTNDFVYNQEKCKRDVGYMIDAVAIDLLYGGNRQAVQSGVYYYGYNSSSTALPGEQTQAVAAYNYIKSILPSIVTGVEITATQQVSVSQVVSGTPGNTDQARRAQQKIEVINDIILNGPQIANTKKPLGINRSTISSIVNAAKIIDANREFIVAETIAYINQKYLSYNRVKCRRDVGFLVDALVYDLAKGGNYNAVIAGRSYYSEHGTHHIVQLEENVTDPTLFPDGAITTFYQRSYMSASGYLFEYVGSGVNYGSLPQRGKADPVQSKETVQLNNGKVFFTSTDQNGDFRIGTGLVISQATGVLSGRTFTKSLFANLTPFILAIEG